MISPIFSSEFGYVPQTYFSDLEGAFDPNKVESYRSEVRLGISGIDIPMEERAKQIYVEEWDYRQDSYQEMAQSAVDSAVRKQATEALQNPVFIYGQSWRFVLASLAEGFYFGNFYWILAFILLFSDVLAQEKTRGTWLILSNTVRGRNGFVLKKYGLCLLFSLMWALVLVTFTVCLSGSQRGGFFYIDQPLEQVLGTISYLKISVRQQLVLVFFYRFLAMAQLSAYILLISSMVFESLGNLIASVLTLNALPFVLQNTPLGHLLIWPQYLSGMAGVFQEAQLPNNALDHFMKAHPLLSNSPTLLLAYTVLIPVLTIVVSLILTKRNVLAWDSK